MVPAQRCPAPAPFAIMPSGAQVEYPAGFVPAIVPGRTLQGQLRGSMGMRLQAGGMGRNARVRADAARGPGRVAGSPPIRAARAKCDKSGKQASGGATLLSGLLPGDGVRASPAGPSGTTRPHLVDAGRPGASRRGVQAHVAPGLGFRAAVATGLLGLSACGQGPNLRTCV